MGIYVGWRVMPRPDAEMPAILDALVVVALLEMGTSSALGSAGIKAAYGQEIPEASNGIYPVMLFLDQPDVTEYIRRTQGNRMVSAEFEEVNHILGVLVLADRQTDLKVLTKASWPWIRRVPAAFYKHLKLDGIVTEVEVKRCRRRVIPWGDAKVAAMLYPMIVRTNPTYVVGA